MKFFFAAFLLSNLLYVKAQIVDFPDEPCLDWSAGFDLNGCTSDRIYTMAEEMLGNCQHSVMKELRLVTNTTTDEAAFEAIDVICSNGWDTAQQTSFHDIDSRFTDEFMDEYINGEGFLNLETGSFGGTAEGTSISEFHGDGAKLTRMNGFEGLDTCALNSIMCCFGRDRQPNDNNGNCASENCVNADPADNSNLCYDFDANLHHGASEGDIHCHGLAWEDDPNEFTSQLKYNNFFFVSLFDHMYQRGYVEHVLDDNDIPMCGCMEDMNIVVSRSDCTEIVALLEFSIKYGEEGLIATAKDNLDIDFNSCQGVNPSNGNAQNNDLASHVNKLYLEAKIEEETKDAIFSTLVGYAQPGNNANEEACEASYEELHNCGICDDVESPWMDNVGVDCTRSNLIDSKCNEASTWRSKKYCQQSCYAAGRGYADDNCCAAPTPAPTNLPDNGCVTCDNVETPWMGRNGKDCTTTDLIHTKCNKNNTWKRNKYCQESCYVNGYGYTGDVCCETAA